MRKMKEMGDYEVCYVSLDITCPSKAAFHLATWLQTFSYPLFFEGL